MSTVTRPRGPLPARVYWVRRTLLLALVFGLVFTMTHVFGGDDAPKSKATAEQASGTTDPGRTAAPQPEKTATVKPRKKKPKVVLAQPDGPCAPSEITVTPTVRTAPAGGKVAIPIELTTTRAACTFVLSSQTVAFKITSGRDQIWTSQQCPRVLGEQSVVVRSAKPATVTVNWNGQRSADDCEDGAGWAAIGGYHAIASALGGEPADQYFELTKPKRPVVTKTRKPKPDEKKNKGKKNKKDKPSTPTEERATGNGAQEPDLTR